MKLVSMKMFLKIGWNFFNLLRENVVLGLLIRKPVWEVILFKTKHLTDFWIEGLPLSIFVLKVHMEF